MRNILFAAVASLAILSGCSSENSYPEPVNPNATPEARELLNSLYRSVDEGKIISGLHHNQLGSTYYRDLDRIAEASGVEPKIWGGDVAWDGAKVVELAKQNYASGHIITLMWHVNRPFDKGVVNFREQTQGDFSDEQWEELMTEGSEMHRKWLAQVDSISVNFLMPLKEAGIPVIWRPYHEMNGEWFWWGWREGENGFKKLYRMMWDRMVNHHHLDNLLWVWNANAPREIPGDTARAYDLYYPGNEYVDVLATDVYNRDWKQSHHDQLVELGGGKLIALGELGSLPSPEDLETMNRYAWFMIWTGFTNDKYNTLENLAAIFDRPNTVSLTPAQDRIYPDEFPISDVTLLDGPLKKAMDLNAEVLLQYDCDRLLAPYRKQAGLEPRKPSYPNWDGLDGHVGGHYLSAMAMYAAQGNAECRERMEYMLSELKECWQASNENNPEWGRNYIGGMPDSRNIWSNFKKGDIRVYSSAWAPFYNLHKMFAGLRDAWVYCGDPTARELFLRFCDWAVDVSSGLSDEQMEAALNTEHGGMPEVLADAYAISGNPAYLECARRFSHKAMLDPLADHKDILDNLHANTQVPKVVGFERISELSGDSRYHDASEFFWNVVTGERSLAFGGNSRREHFPTRETSIDFVNDIDGPESCNTNNMLKLTEELHRADPDSRYADYYERATFNHILSTQHPEHGGYVYFTSARPRHYRNYSVPNEAMWCCVGTGMENHGKYGQFIYTKVDGDLYVNLYAASELDWRDKGVVMRQETAFPYSESSRISVASGSGDFSVMLRKPAWTDGFAVKVNGRRVKADQFEKGYLRVSRKWKEGDVIEVSFPMHGYVEHMPNVPQYVAIMYGPVLLGIKTGTEDLKALLADDSRFGQYASGEKLPIDKAPYLIADDVDSIGDDLVPVKGKPLHFTLSTRMENPIEGELQPFFEIHDSRYMMYWLAFDDSDYQSYLENLAKEEEARQALESRTVDKVQPGEQQPETDHDMVTDQSVKGDTDGAFYRDASDGHYFGYTMVTGGRTGLNVRVKYWGQDEWRSCEYDLLVDGKLVRSVNNTRKWRTSQFKYEEYPIPDELLKGKDEVKVRFVAHKGRQVGQIYEVRLVSGSE